MALHEQFRSCLEAGDLPGLRAIWAVAAPHLPQDLSETDAEIVMHHARTSTRTVSLKARAYSHRWLLERNLPSALPDRLKPRAEQLYPRSVTGVGISINARNPLLKPATVLIRTAMEGAVEEVYADGKGDDVPLVKERMAVAREVETRKLFGRWGA